MSAQRAEVMPLGVVLERREIDHPWCRYRWRAVAAVPGAEPVEGPRVVAADEGVVRFHAATLPLRLFRKETEGYRYNLQSEQPSVYVVLRADSGDAEAMMRPFLVTACPFEGQGYDTEDSVVQAVPMPEEVRSWVARFVAAYHVDRPVYKRPRKPHDPRKQGFGQRGGPRRM